MINILFASLDTSSVIKIGLKSNLNIYLNFFKYVSSFVFKQISQIHIISESIEAPSGGQEGSVKYKTNLHVFILHS